MGFEPVDFGGQPFDGVVFAGRGLLAVEGPHRRGEVVEDLSEFARAGGGDAGGGNEHDRHADQLRNGRSHWLRPLPRLGIVPLSVSPLRGGFHAIVSTG